MFFSNCLDAMATDLIIEFLLNSHTMNSGERSNRVVDVENPDALPAGGPEIKTRKSLALKILALKCVSHLKWNFQLLENRYFDYITNFNDCLLIS